MFVQKTTNELSQTMDTYTDIRGRQRKTVQNGEITTKFIYNPIGELMQVMDNEGFITGYLYDMAGRKTEMQHPDRGVVRFRYDKAGRMTEQSNSTMLLAGEGEKIEYFYDFSRLIRVEYPQNPLNKVEYTYGNVQDPFAVAERAVGRLLYQKDASGVQLFGYGRMGEVTKNLRSVAVAGYQPYWFLTSWTYDSWNRIQEIVYPDQEIVRYRYNEAGMLDAIHSEITNLPNLQPVVSLITYNDYGERTQLERGNGTITTYSYDVRRRMNNVANSFTNFNISKSYTFDELSNITHIRTDVPENSLPASGQLGGPVNHTYHYDDYNRLYSGYGDYTGPDDETTPYLKQNYTLDMQYNADHTIKKKTQVQHQGQTDSYGGAVTNVSPVYKNSYIIDYSDYKKGAFVIGNYGYLQPHAPRTIKESPSWESNLASDDPRIKVKKISYDANGNLTEIKEQVGPVSTSLRKNLWDEENRLLAVDLKPDEPTDHPIAIYTYDAGGQRIVRYNMDRTDVSSNAEEVAQITKENVMLYPSGLLMGKALHNPKKEDRVMTYTKHYYIGSERISAKTGTAAMGFYPKNDVLGQFPTFDDVAIKAAADEALTDAETIVTGIYAKFLPTAPVFNRNGEDGTSGYNHSGGEEDLNIYYFHPDHLGSSAYISNAAGVVTQHMEYLPFGETMVDEHTNSFNSPFKYNGKEFDEETGNYYYSARYYDPKWSIFISVDPLAEQTMDAYGYCYQNPVNLTDPSGMSADPPVTGMDTPNGTKYSDGTGSWIYNQEFNIWEGQNGASDFSNSIGMSEITINKIAKDPYEGTYFDRDNYNKGPNPYSPSTDWRYSVAIIAIVALPIAIEAYGASAVGSYLLEEAGEAVFEAATGIPVIIDPIDIVENGIKKGVIQLTKKTFGHTFATHGDEMTSFLINRAKGSGMAQGQFLDNQQAAQFILDNVGKTTNGAINVPIPNGFQARVIMPDGTFRAATHVRLVPGGGGVKTAYPLIP